MNLVPLFLVSLAAVGYEIALTRYFAVAKWSEYGYWVISIVMVGFALSGVVLALWRDLFVRKASVLMASLPAALVLTAARGIPLHDDEPFQPAAIAESGDLAAADLEHRRILRRAAAILFSGRSLRQLELRAQRGPDRPGLCI